jgi:hypothetical protein
MIAVRRTRQRPQRNESILGDDGLFLDVEARRSKLRLYLNFAVRMVVWIVRLVAFGLKVLSLNT